MIFRPNHSLLIEAHHSGGDPEGGAGAVLTLRRSTVAAADRGEAPGGAARPKRAVSVRGSSVARAAPEARAGGNIRPRGAATTLAPPGAPCLPSGRSFVNACSKARTRSRAARTGLLTCFPSP